MGLWRGVSKSPGEASTELALETVCMYPSTPGILSCWLGQPVGILPDLHTSLVMLSRVLTVMGASRSSNSTQLEESEAVVTAGTWTSAIFSQWNEKGMLTWVVGEEVFVFGLKCYGFSRLRNVLVYVQHS